MAISKFFEDKNLSYSLEPTKSNLDDLYIANHKDDENLIELINLQDKVIKKSNFLIQKISMGYNELTQNIFQWLLTDNSYLKTKIKNKVYYKYNIQRFLAAAELSSNGKKYNSIKTSLYQIYSLGGWVETKSLDGTTQKWFETFRVFESMIISEKSGDLYIQFNENFIDIFRQDKNKFTPICLKTYISLNGKYTKNLYEYLRSVINLKKSIKIDIKYLRELLRIPKTYQYDKIKTRIINLAIKEINLKSDIEIIEIDKDKFFEEIKENKKVKSIILNLRFSIKKTELHTKQLSQTIEYSKKNKIPKKDRQIYEYREIKNITNKKVYIKNKKDIKKTIEEDSKKNKIKLKEDFEKSQKDFLKSLGFLSTSED